MTTSWIRTPALAGLGLSLSLAAALLLSVVGCGGGKGPESGEAVVVPEPNAVPAVGTTTPSTPTGRGTSTSTPAPTPAATTPAAATSTTAEGWGTLKGQVTLKGDPPKPKELVAKGSAPKDPTVCAKDAPILSERLVVDNATKGVKNVLVYIPKPTKVNEEAKSNAQTAQVVFDQEKCTFTPHVLAVMTGAKVDLKNSDPVNHNINSRLRNNPFNKLLSASQDVPQPVDAPERTPGELTCDIHPWMRSYWMVLDHPYFAVTDEKGNFEIKNVPSGTQKVVVWQEAVTPNKFVTAPSGDSVDIKANDTTTKDFAIDATKVSPE
jgi:plastocyanin